VGNLTRDPVYFDGKGTSKVAKFDIATRVGYDTEKKEDRVEFVPVTAFGVSDAIKDYLKKGRLVSVSGRVGTDSFEKEGKTTYVTSVKAFNGDLRLLGAAPKAKTEEAETIE